jgi:hypothetical protein
MKYRKLSTTGDYVFGNGDADFYTDSPNAVAQAVKTRLLLLTGEWFLNLSDGTPYSTDILGSNTKDFYDVAIQGRILDTPGVSEIVSYQSQLINRALTVTATINTAYGIASVSGTIGQ